jgi:hypothetical protein
MAQQRKSNEMSKSVNLHSGVAFGFVDRWQLIEVSGKRFFNELQIEEEKRLIPTGKCSSSSFRIHLPHS